MITHMCCGPATDDKLEEDWKPWVLSMIGNGVVEDSSLMWPGSRAPFASEGQHATARGGIDCT